MLFNNIFELIGNTPLLKLKEEKNNNKIYAKLEKYNLSGSIKDRASYYMLKEAYKCNLIDQNTTIIEPTSGNTGIGLAYFSLLYKLKLIIVMPSSMSEERRKLIKDYGATLELVEGNMQDCINRANELKNEIENSFIPSQFENYNNVLAHYETTGPEIYKDLPNIDVVICGIGSGGTISGLGRYLKEKNPNIKIIGVEPLQSPIITSGKGGKHKIQGIGAGFIPKILELDIVDEVITVDETDAINCAKELLINENLFVGISSGAVMTACKQYISKVNDKNIVLIFADGGERYTWN